MPSLLDVDVLAVDCQATAAAPRGHLIELGWARLGAAPVTARSRLIALPPDTRLPPSVARITGISPAMMREAIPAADAWRELRDDLGTNQQPTPAIAHFARFERPFLEALGEATCSLDLVCTHEIARKLLPDLPRCTLRAVAGYFGAAVGPCRRSAEHVKATAFVWRELATLLASHGVATWAALHAWLAAPRRKEARRAARRTWPMPRPLRLALPDAPGVYRMLRTSGDVLYVGKAASLHYRVNSYFRKQHGTPERLLEMLSQARGLSFELTASAVEAALLEPDEIKRHRPPYNIALTDRPDALLPRTPGATTPGRDGRYDVTPELLRLGTRLWKEGRRGREGEAEEGARGELEQLAIRAALARRRERWIARLSDSSLVWNEAGVERARLLVLHKGEIVLRDDVPRRSLPPVPPGHARAMAERRAAFTVASFDRVRVLLTEVKRLVSERSPVAVRFGTGRPLEGARLARVLSWL